MIEAAALYTNLFMDMGLFAGMVIVLLAFVIGAAAWLLWRINPTLSKISENNLQIANAQEATSYNLKATADLLHSMSVTFATHDQRAAIMHETCKDHGTMLCDAKDVISGFHREVMTKLTEIHGEVKLSAK